MDIVIEFLKDINIAQLLAIGAMGWFLYSRLDQKIERLKVEGDQFRQELKAEIAQSKQELKAEIDQCRQELKAEIDQSRHEFKSDFDKLCNKVEDIDRRLCRIEGSLAFHGHCLFSQSHQEKKAE